MKAIAMLLALGLTALPVEAKEEPRKGWLGDVSLVQLLTSPKQFAGEVLMVAGYLESPGSQLYLTAEHARAWDQSSSISIAGADLLDKNGEPLCQHLWVSIKGRFTEIRPGEYVLKDIEQIYVPSTKSFCYKRAATGKSPRP